MALAYLLGGFTDYQHLGYFNRFYLFGPKTLETAMDEVAVVSDRWGYLRCELDCRGHDTPKPQERGAC